MRCLSIYEYKSLYDAAREPRDALMALPITPYSIYGRRRGARYVGQIHFVFNTAEHISVLNRQFDDLIRAAVIHSIEVGPYLRGLLPRIREHG